MQKIIREYGRTAWCVHKWNRWNCRLILNSADFWQLFLFVYVKFISDLASNLNLAKFLFSIDLPLYSIFRAIFYCHKDYFIFQFKVFLNTFHNIKFSSQSFDVSEMFNNISNLCLYISIGMKTQTGLFFVFWVKCMDFQLTIYSGINLISLVI